MAKSVTLKDQEGNELYPVTDIDLVNGTIDSTRLGSSAVTNAKIAAKAVEYDNINFSTFGPVWSTIHIGTVLADKTVTVTTRKGTKLVLGITNGGNGLFVVSGGENIVAFRQYWTTAFPSLQGKYGMIGVAKSSTIWVRFFSAIVNGGSVSAGEMSTVASDVNSATGTAYGDLASVGSANKVATGCSLTGERFGSTAWRFQGMIGSAGVADCMSFEGECTAFSAGSTPTTYQRGASSSNLTYVNNTLEVLEA